MPFRINDKKPVKKYKTIWIKIEDFRKLNWMLCLFMIKDKREYERIIISEGSDPAKCIVYIVRYYW